ncbi:MULTISPECIES: hypothetical protein [Idiomarina]|uniref:hypothetical protein n=1 Tax=Idiomarina TaxID=135575 RepID=UPI00129B7E40|nr:MULTISPECIES: hypothetical protein [Idiomarina]MRJ40834.1 hypothetical protein [Idiomarina sp. FeN1]NCU56638.1 hypothetical protein [Idiomarina sp. FenA--70]NCU59018.1 hypothetical protein [Idiomarina sp. FenBw--71]UUN14486.1 hypothetical protein KGF88_04540 [Idiomarina loihiensis]
MPMVIAAVAVGVAAGVVYGVTVGIIVGIGVLALQNAIKPEMPSVEENITAAQTMTTQPLQPRRGVYGEQVVSGSLVGYGRTKQGDKDVHVCVITLAGHNIESASLYEINGNPPHSGCVAHIYDGTQTVASAHAKSHCEGWTDDHIGHGVAYAVVYIPIDPDAMSGGLQNVTFKVKGAKVYDPRKDTTVGGDGPHRADDPLTWEWSNNSILCALDYVRFKGFQKLSLNKFDLAHIVEQANICDEEVEYQDAGGASHYERRFTANGTWMYDESPPSVLQRLLMSCGGKPYRRGGKIYLQTASYHGLATLTLTENDAADIIKISPHRELRDRVNLVRASFVDPKKGYQPTDAPVHKNAGYIASDGMELEDDLQLSFTNSSTMAQRLMKYHMERNRAGMRIEFPCKGKGLSALAGKTVRISLPNEGIDKEFIVAEWDFDRRKKITNLLLEEESPLLYSDSTVPNEGDITPNTNLPDFNVPEPPESVAFTLDAVSVHRQGFVEWSHPVPRAVSEYIIRLVKDSATVVEYSSVASSSVQMRQDINGLDAGQYSIEIYAKNRFERLSAPATVSITLNQPSAPTQLLITAGNWEATCKPVLAGIGLGTMFEFAFGDTTNVIGRGASISQPGLVPETQYTFYARTINPLGQSAWVSQTFTTTKVPEQIDPLLPESQVIQGINDTLTGIDQRIDEEAGRIDSTEESIDELVASTRNIGYMLNAEGIDRTASDMQAMLAIANQSAARLEMERRQRSGERLIGAVVEVNPETGEITNLAYSYTDSAFTQAVLRMDGIDGSINAAVERISLNEGAVENLSSELTLLPGLIEARATAIVASSISALQPAHAFNFFDSTQHWEAVTGTIAPVNNAIELTHGDIENTRLFYDAAENPVLRVEVERLAGTGWSGTVIVYFDGGGSQSYPGIIDAVEAGELVVRNVDFRGLETYAGMINGMRIELGASAADEFRVKSLTIGKPDAAMQQLEQVEYRVNDAFIAIDGLEAQINLRVTSEHYNENTVTFGNVEQTLDAIESYAQIKATYTTLTEDGTIAKANAAAVFIDGQTGTITQIVQTINNRVDDVEGQAQDAAQTANQAMSEVDTANGRIRNQVISTTQNAIADAENAVAAVLEAYQGFLQGQELANTRISLASARRDLQAQSTELSAFANETLKLLAVTAQEAEALEARVDQAFTAISNAEAALTQARISLQSQILGAGTDATRKATANALDLLNARIGYCELNDSPTGHETREACEDAGGTWITAPLAEALRNVQVQTEDGSYARVSQLAQAFVDDDGQLTAIGSMLTDNAGRISGMLNRNTGLESSLDFIAGQTRIGDVDSEGAFIPLFWLDAAAGVLAIKARLILGDGHQVNTLDDIRGQDGNSVAVIYAMDSSGTDQSFIQGSRKFVNYYEYTSTAPTLPVTADFVRFIGEDGQPAQSIWPIYADTETGANQSFNPSGKTWVTFYESVNQPTLPVTATFVKHVGDNGNNGVSVLVVYADDAAGNNQSLTAGTRKFINYYEYTGAVPTLPISATFVQFIGNDGSPGQSIWPIYATDSSGSNQSFDATGKTWVTFYESQTQPTLPVTGIFVKHVGTDGTNGLPGAGMYGQTYSSISWVTATANSRFTTLVGRAPVPLDIFVQTRTDGTDSQARQYNGSNWVAPAIMLHGSLIATDTIAGDKLIAGTSLNAPVIMSGQIQMVGASHMKITTATPFGPNDLIEWYGPKNTYTYNSSNGTVKFDGLTKANAITYLSATGQAYFGGSITAGTLKNAVQSSQLGNTDVTVGPFGSNGGIIEIKCSLSASRSTGLTSGLCPNPAPPNPSATLKLYRATSGGEILVATQAVSGSYRCIQEGPEKIESWSLNGSFTYTDNLQTTSSRTYRLEVTNNTTPLLPNGNQRLSLITEEA